jgi:hypothetical protein
MKFEELVKEARGWLTDAFPGDDIEGKSAEERSNDLTENEVVFEINRHYVGGWKEFVKNTDVQSPEEEINQAIIEIMQAWTKLSRVIEETRKKDEDFSLNFRQRRALETDILNLKRIARTN